MATQQPDNDELVRDLARAILDNLRTKYWDAKKANPPPSFDELYDLRRAYEDAAAEYAGLEGRLLRDDILTKEIDLENFRKVRDDMAAAVETKEILGLAANFIKMMVALA